jgi:hypothetical protein
MCDNGGLNNRQIILGGVVTKKNMELWGVKGTDKRNELKQLLTCSM